MAYKLIVTEHADELLDNILRYLVYQLKNEQAALVPLHVYQAGAGSPPKAFYACAGFVIHP